MMSSTPKAPIKTPYINPCQKSFAAASNNCFTRISSLVIIVLFGVGGGLVGAEP
jgi:hypothetical protein